MFTVGISIFLKSSISISNWIIYSTACANTFNKQEKTKFRKGIEKRIKYIVEINERNVVKSKHDICANIGSLDVMHTRLYERSYPDN